jgi:hypothetical protein
MLAPAPKRLREIELRTRALFDRVALNEEIYQHSIQQELELVTWARPTRIRSECDHHPSSINHTQKNLLLLNRRS